MAQEDNLVKFIGKGITFPIQLNERGAVIVTSGTQLIRSSLKLILSWPYNTRFFLPEFGSKVEELLEEPNDQILETVVRNFIVESIIKWEKRIEIVNVQIGRPEDTKIDIQLTYRLSNSEIMDSFIFPFYKLIRT